MKSNTIEEIAAVKQSICNECPLLNNGHCSSTRKAEAVIDFEYKGEERTKGTLYPGCSCLISAKVRSNSKCPLGKF